MSDMPSPSSPPKKRRQVTVACHNCRQRKIACDAAKPSCTHCSNRGIACRYAHDIREGETRHQAQLRENEITRSRLKEVESAFRWLKDLPKDQAMRYLQDVLHSDADPIAALTALAAESATSITPAISGGATTVLPYRRVSLVYELTTLHPISYPLLVPVEKWRVRAGEQSLSQSPIGGQSRHPLVRLDDQAHAGDATGTERGAVSSETDRPLPRVQLTAPVHPAPLCDPRLKDISISTWTNVQISDAQAANVISRYLETDHPILGFFDADLFVDDLLRGRTDFCSPLLVSSVLYWGCQMYASTDSDAHLWGFRFLAEAKQRWAGERDQQSILAIASGYLLSLGLKCYCNDNLSESFVEQSTRLATDLRLFGVTKAADELELEEQMPRDASRAKAHVAWGAYSWLALMAHYYGTAVSPLAPSFRIPGEFNDERRAAHAPSLVPPPLRYIGGTFTALCRLRRIHTKVLVAYNTKEQPSPLDAASLQFAEDTYKEMLRWSDELGRAQRRGEHAPDHVLLLHIQYHAMILQLFRPFLGRQLRLRSFTAYDSMPEAVVAASLDQLKALAVTYHRSQPSAAYTILWHISLLNIGNSVLSSAGHADWHFFFVLCINAYQDLSKCFRIAAGFMQGLLWLATKSGLISPRESLGFLEQFFQDRADGFRTLRSAHIVDLDQAARNVGAAENVTVAIEKLEALGIDENTVNSPRDE